MHEATSSSLLVLNPMETLVFPTLPSPLGSQPGYLSTYLKSPRGRPADTSTGNMSENQVPNPTCSRPASPAVSRAALHVWPTPDIAPTHTIGFIYCLLALPQSTSKSQHISHQQIILFFLIILFSICHCVDSVFVSSSNSHVEALTHNLTMFAGGASGR